MSENDLKLENSNSSSKHNKTRLKLYFKIKEDKTAEVKVKKIKNKKKKKKKSHEKKHHKVVEDLTTPKLSNGTSDSPIEKHKREKDTIVHIRTTKKQKIDNSDEFQVTKVGKDPVRDSNTPKRTKASQNTPVIIESPRGIESGEGTPSSDKKKKIPLTTVLSTILKRVMDMDKRDIFYEPVTDDIAPDYSSVIDHPMCFLVMKERLSSKCYPTLAHCVRDFYLIFDNCIKYNQDGSIYNREAERIKAELDKLVLTYKDRLNEDEIGDLVKLPAVDDGVIKSSTTTSRTSSIISPKTQKNSSSSSSKQKYQKPLKASPSTSKLFPSGNSSATPKLGTPRSSKNSSKNIKSPSSSSLISPLSSSLKQNSNNHIPNYTVHHKTSRAEPPKPKQRLPEILLEPAAVRKQFVRYSHHDNRSNAHLKSYTMFINVSENTRREMPVGYPNLYRNYIPHLPIPYISDEEEDDCNYFRNIVLPPKPSPSLSDTLSTIDIPPFLQQSVSLFASALISGSSDVNTSSQTPKPHPIDMPSSSEPLNTQMQIDDNNINHENNSINGDDDGKKNDDNDEDVQMRDSTSISNNNNNDGDNNVDLRNYLDCEFLEQVTKFYSEVPSAGPIDPNDLEDLSSLPSQGFDLSFLPIDSLHHTIPSVAPKHNAEITKILSENAEMLSELSRKQFQRPSASLSVDEKLTLWKLTQKLNSLAVLSFPDQLISRETVRNAYQNLVQHFIASPVKNPPSILSSAKIVPPMAFYERLMMNQVPK